jgi:hypothetical protein
LLGASSCSLFFVRDGSPPTRNYTLPVVDSVAVAAGIGGTAGLIAYYGRGEGTALVAFPIIVAALIFSQSAIYGFTTVYSRRSGDEQLESSSHKLRDEQVKHERIQRELTETAEQAARAGDCDTVRKLDPLARDVDANFHDTVFLRSDPIARCLSPAAIPPDAGVLDAPGASVPADATR